MRPKVSVIIPCYNYEKYIEQCILSVIVQRINFNIEIIIRDDNSTDNSYQIAMRIANFYQNEQFQFRVYKNDYNTGEIINTKRLLDDCKGEYIAYLDADDYWSTPHKLQVQVDFLDNNNDYSMCVSGYIELENQNKWNSVDFSWWMFPVNNTTESLTKMNYLSSSSSRVFRNYPNLIKDYFHLFPYSDWPLNFELSLLGKIECMNFPGYVYRKHYDSLSENQIKIEVNNHKELLEKRQNILEKELSIRLQNVL